MRYLTLILFLFCCSLNAVPYKIISGTTNQDLAEKIAAHLGMELSPVEIRRFSDGEIRIKIEENMRNSEVYVIQSTCDTETGSVNDHMMELYLLIRTLKRASAEKVIAVIPYFGYARQDRKTESRVPISASDIAMLLEMAGADQVISVDLHCGQIQGFFHSVPVDNLYGSPIFLRYLSEKKDLNSLVVVSPDAGGVERAKKFIDGMALSGLDASLAMIIKQRGKIGTIEKMDLVGDVFEKDAIIIDDICDTAGTLVQAAYELKRHGARRVFACISHPVFSGPALERIAGSELTELIVTDTIPHSAELPENIVQLTTAPLIAEAIDRTHKGESVSRLFNYR